MPRLLHPARVVLSILCAGLAVSVTSASPVAADVAVDPPDSLYIAPGGGSAAPDTLPMTPPIVVTAPRLRIPLAENPAATTVVEDALRDMPRTIAANEALATVPGVLVDNQAGGERVHISSRGIGILTERGVRGIKVLLDDLPLNDPTGFAPDLFDVDWATVRRVEVFRGPASAFYGGGAAGGIIAISTCDGGPERVGGRALAEIGSYGFWKGLAQTDGADAGRTWRVTASRTMGDGYRDHTAFHATNLYAKLGWRLGERGRLTAIVAGTSFFNENAEGLNLDRLAQDRRLANPDALLYNEFQRTRRGTVGLTGRAPVGPGDLSFRLYGRQTKYDESVPSSVLHRLIGTPGVGVQYALPVRTGRLRHRLAAGVDLDGQTVDEYRRPNLGGAHEGTEIVSDQTIRAHGAGIFLIDRMELGRGWSVMAGVRYDHIRNELDDNLRTGGVDLSGDAVFEKTTARCGIAWSPRPALGTYASWGQGFLPPATEELANNPARLGGFNAGLEPATSRGEEVGVRGAVATLSYDLAAFHLITDGDFGRYRVPSRPLETFYENAGRSRRWGVESLLTWQPLAAATLRLAYTWSRFRYDHADYDGVTYRDTRVPNSPEHAGYVDAEYRFAGRFTVGVGGEARSRWYVDASNAASVDGYALLHARLSARWDVGGREWTLTLSGTNLTGKEYIAFTEPDPDGNSYQPAATAELYGALGARF